MTSVFPGFDEKSWFFSEQFLARESALQIREELLALKKDFRPAHVGSGASKKRLEDVRRDEILWLGTKNPPAISSYLEKLEKLKIHWNQKYFLGLKEIESHLTAYEPGAFYEKHVDNFQGKSPRKISLILYLNPDWQEADGGELIVYDKTDRQVARIAPRLGGLAGFISEDTPHEVLRCEKQRLSLTSWMRD